MAADHVVALPELEVPEIEGIPQRFRGFIPTDTRLNVEGLTDVWAAGDATWFPIKQGGLAAQQADVAAEAIAARAGAQVPISAFRPVLARRTADRRHAPLLPVGTLPGRRRGGEPDGPLVAADEARGPLSRPDAERRGSPRARRRGVRRPRAPVVSELADATEHHRSELDFALAAADADARKGDFGGALGWLRLAEELNLVLPPAYLERRESWRERQDAHVG